MARLRLPILSCLLMSLAGCLIDDPRTEIVSDNPFGHTAPSPPTARTSYAPPTIEIAARVDQVGRKINAANLGSADQLHRAELGKYEQEYGKRFTQTEPADTRTLALGFLTRSGYTASELAAAEPLLKAAAESNTFAKQIVPMAGQGQATL